ncbi:MAG: hypothetical protein GTO13_18685 [Proteobacteria bacterium]|nr:hypothetical protein [Pseudomonadota bacterium]
MTGSRGFAKNELSRGVQEFLILWLSWKRKFDEGRIFLIRYIGLLIPIALTFWVYHDAKKREKTPANSLTWAAGVLLSWIVF